MKNIKLDETEAHALSSTMNTEGFEIIKNILEQYKEYYTIALINANEKEVADKFRGNIQALHNFEKYLDSALNKSKREMESKVIEI